MITIPQEYLPILKKVIEWNLATYVEDEFFHTPLERVLERMEKGISKAETVQLERKDLYNVRECLSNVRSNAVKCGVEESIIYDIYKWIDDEYIKYKHA